MAAGKRRIIEWESLSKWEQAVMVVMLPVFAIVAGIEHVIAKVTGLTYNEVNIIIYYLLIPLSWAVMIDFITMLPLLSPMYIVGWIVFLWKDPMRFRDRCDWAFGKSVDFLLWFKICVVVPALVYAELIYGIIKMKW